ncbi:FKBP-type peptidyl-prolyl cis-trans isomerase [Porphyromonas circumdentaria]|uniref:Peptidyl-prolyl cis-trans isomerase n=1 Tax=Porphyromonas circumdentaria TaxID=29524 RepID=A0A1T4PJN0_9PORP|nr:FKBP-type peptidyl-prolyl cis-trans isomerase [Porphyromonas circumdentaria]MBB6276407.1 FKBP-type peptidyl-prolyl cis-trans isomerase [Porphyromonas circumdentaria]MDO4722538.1 FKBP-type peptidyl-prolyl cis-trans isomerase [Porphyromonas circumdentaria]SJZ91774.1 FKBP-type peptidyl-prolyl cis-trans isomerase FkpA [Porphyromonas circumdentaria]
MKKLLYAALASATMFGAISCTGSSKTEKDPANDSLAMARGYVMGMQMGQQLMYSAMQGQAIDTALFLQGFKEGITKAADSTKFSYYAGTITGHQMGSSLVEDKIDQKLFLKYFEAGLMGDTTLTKWSMEDAMTYLNGAEQKLEEKKLETKFGKNKTEGAEYLAKFAQEEGVQKTESGIAYKVITPGTGATPTEKDRVKVHYVGTLINGEEFDKSGEEPVEFGVTQVISGWTEILQLMKEGEKVKVVIPQELAYGQRQTGNIDPFSTLVFEITLVEVVK